MNHNRKKQKQLTKKKRQVAKENIILVFYII